MPGLIRGVARVAAVSGTATAVSNRVSRRQGNRWAQQEQQAAPAPVPQQAAPAAPAAVDVDQLKKLAELHDQGVLTDAEFQTQKARLLGS